MKWFVKCIKNYVNFTGRARRAEFWYFSLFYLIFLVVASMLDWMLFDTPSSGPIYFLLSLFLFLPSTAVTVRRLHDIGRSGKWLLTYFIMMIVYIVSLVISGFSFIVAMIQGVEDAEPSVAFLCVCVAGVLMIFIWAIVLLVWLCLPGDKGDNKYGPDPKAGVAI